MKCTQQNTLEKCTTTKANDNKLVHTSDIFLRMVHTNVCNIHKACFHSTNQMHRRHS